MADQGEEESSPPPDATPHEPPLAPSVAAAAAATTTKMVHPRPKHALLPHEPDAALLESFRYINAMPGKNVRGKLMDCFQLWIKVESPAVLDIIKDIVGDLHNASLMIDDIEDNSKLRRGIPVAHSIFGIPTVINAANYAYFLALEKCHALDNKQAMSMFVGELLNLHRGQGYDIMVGDEMG
jgi:geranylgeranyl diphosphate synthase, type III